MKTLNDKQIVEIKRLVNGGTTSTEAICRMYGLTEAQLQQVIAYKEGTHD